MIPWFAGCEYQCQEEGDGCAGAKFYDEQELLRHISTHGVSVGEYLAKHSGLETKAAWMICLICRKKMKRCLPEVVSHFKACHQGVTLEQYTTQFNIPKMYKVRTQHYYRLIFSHLFRQRRGMEFPEN